MNNKLSFQLFTMKSLKADGRKIQCFIVNSLSLKSNQSKYPDSQTKQVPKWKITQTNFTHFHIHLIQILSTSYYATSKKIYSNLLLFVFSFVFNCAFNNSVRYLKCVLFNILSAKGIFNFST